MRLAFSVIAAQGLFFFCRAETDGKFSGREF